VKSSPKEEVVDPKEGNSNNTTVEEAAQMGKTNGNGKRNLPVVKMTREEAEAIDTAKLLEAMTPRISERRAKKVLVDVIGDETVTVTEPETLMDWTYKHVAVTGAKADEVQGSKTPKQTLSAKQFKELDGAGMAALVKEYTTEKRAGQIMLALIEFGLKPSPEQIVELSNARIAVEGVENPRVAGPRRDSVVLVKGVSVNGK